MSSTSHQGKEVIVRRGGRSPDAAIYSPLPKGWANKNHYYFYGWAVGEEFLRQYVTKHGLTVSKRHRNDITMLYALVILNLQRRSGFGHINLVEAKIDELSAQFKERLFATSDGPALVVFAIGCTESKYLFNRRPTKKQLEKLVELMKEEPSWFEDVDTKAEFDLEGYM